MKRRDITFVLSALMMLAPVASAQLSAEGGPILTDQDKLELVQSENTAYLVGNVAIRQGESQLRADRVTIKFAKSESEGKGLRGQMGEIQEIIADGNVYYITPEMKAKSDKGNYKVASDTITMSGRVALMRGEDVAEGATLRIEVGKGRTVLDGGSGRARALITPEAQDSDN